MKFFKLKIATVVFVMVLVGCSSTGPKYQESVVLDPSTNLARYAPGYWSGEITSKHRKSEVSTNDKLFIVGFYDEDVSRFSVQKIYAAKRAAELTIESGFECLTLFPEEKFKDEFFIGGGGAHTFNGTVSESGLFSGSTYQTAKISFNRDRINYRIKGRFLLFPGSVLYFVTHRYCPNSVSQDYSFEFTIGLSGQSRTDTYVTTENIFRAAHLLDTMNRKLSGKGETR